MSKFVLKSRSSSSLVLCSEALEALKKLPSNSIDSCVTDPPYELGFMGKKWDKSGIANSVELWSEVLRILKPGGHLLSFGGTRTYHRMATAIEDAGFEIRDTIQWLYGCLSEDTEILTQNGWVHYRKATQDSLVCGYNLETDELEWVPVEETFEYDYCDTAYRLQSDSTDQIVSRNHRCIVERSGSLVFQIAETLELKARVPVLENMHGLLKALRVPYKGTSGAQPNVLERVHIKYAQRSATKGRCAGQAGDGRNTMRGVREIYMETESMVKTRKNTDVLLRLQRSSARKRVERARKQGSRCVDAGSRGIMQGKDDRRIQSCVEGRRNLLSQTRELQTNQICAVPIQVPGYGTKRRLRDGTPFNRRSVTGKMLASSGSCSPRRPRSSEQPANELNALCVQQRPQAVRASRFSSTDLVRVEPVYYVGKVWCVRVRTGAFVARRNGKAFITGNSGFPKSMDVSKAIDKMAGAEREIISTGKAVKRMIPGADQDKTGSWIKDNGREFIPTETAPATDEAKEWEGWGTALKPANEPICLARKPLSEPTVAANVLKWGTGALNIDACRIECGSRPLRTNDESASGLSGTGGAVTYGSYAVRGSKAVGATDEGRWPANVVMDEEAGAMLDAQSGQSRSSKGKPRSSAKPGNGYGMTHTGAEYEDSGGASRFFYCAKANRSERGSGNDHPTVKPQALIRWLVKLVTPPNGIVLDPFCGSGTTGLACQKEGFRYILIDQDPHYIEITNRRLRGGV